MRYLFILLTAALFSSSLHAAVVEKNIQLPNALGSAVLYSNTKASEPGPAIVVVHEWWGLNDYARQRAKQLAEAGFSAIAVDMYGHGKNTSHPKNATAFMNAALAEPDKMNARFDAALDILRQQKHTDPEALFAIGYCFGGAVVLNQARRGLPLAGVASFHGSLGTEKPSAAGSIKAKVLVATGGADPMVPAAQVASFMSEMSTAEVDLQLLSFPLAQHSFTNPGSTAIGKQYQLPLAYNADADQRSWAALMRFLGN